MEFLDTEGRVDPRAVVFRRELEVMRLLAKGVGTPDAITQRVGFTRRPARILRLLNDLAERKLVFLSETGRWRLTPRGWFLIGTLDDENETPAVSVNR